MTELDRLKEEFWDNWHRLGIRWRWWGYKTDYKQQMLADLDHLIEEAIKEAFELHRKAIGQVKLPDKEATDGKDD